MKTSNLYVALCFIFFGSWIFVTQSFSQYESGIGPRVPNTSAASFYYISKVGEVTMQVNIWGAIQKPGRYEIPISTDLIQLVSYAGGPNSDAELDEVLITRSVKKDGSTLKEQYKVNLDELDEVDDALLTLHPGDTIFIDRSSWSTVRDVLTIVTTAAIITSAVANVIIAKERYR